MKTYSYICTIVLAPLKLQLKFIVIASPVKIVQKYFHSSGQFCSIYIRPKDNETTVAYSDAEYSKILEVKGGKYNPSEYKKLVKKVMATSLKFPEHQSELPDRQMKDSFLSMTLTPGKDEMVESHYIETFTPYSLLFGLIDIFGVAVSDLHVDIPSFNGQLKPYAYPTIMLDHLQLTDDLYLDKPIRISGHVSRVGKTSIEIDGEIDQRNSTGRYITAGTCAIAVAARKPNMSSSAIVNPLVPKVDGEKHYMDKITHRAHLRQIFLQDVATSAVPRIEHVEVQKQMKLAKREKSVSIESTKVIKTFVTRPENRNKVYITFGGFILAAAEATAFEAASKFSKSKDVKLYHVGHVRFMKPVPIGNQLEYEAVVAAEVRDPHLLYVAVISESKNTRTSKAEIAAAFHFVYRIQDNIELPLLFPQDDYEKRLQINGLRFIRFIHEPDAMYPHPYQI